MNNKKWSLLAVILIVIGFAGMAYQGFNFGDEYPYHEQKWTLDSLDSLAVNSSYDVDVEFIQSKDGSNYIEIKGNMTQDTIDKLKETTLSGPDVNLDLTGKEQWGFLVINLQNGKQHINVALADPKMLDTIRFELRYHSGNFSGLQAKNIELATSSGNLSASSITSEHLTMKTKSGNIKVAKVQGDTLISNTSGNVTVEQLQGALTAHGTSGGLAVHDLEGPLEANLTSGNIKIKNFTGVGVIKNTSGNVSISGQRSDSLDILVRSGNVNLSVDPKFRGIYDLKVDSGNIKAPDSPMETTDLIKIRTNSGNIRIE